MANKIVRLNRVGMRYSTERSALNDVSFDLEKGEFAYVTGVNGAGKTTLLKLLFAMEKATEGSIVVNNRDLSQLPKSKIFQYRREVGFVFQDFKLLPDLTIFDNVSLPLEVRSMSKSEVEYRVKGVLSLVGLADRAKDYPQMLSGGEQQRIVIARSIIGKPFLLLADEPTGNLDGTTAKEIMSLFMEINDMGTTVLIATHDDHLMEEFPSRVIELKSGRIISDMNEGDNA
jgi:cell division transport system ATP-binding protein